MTEYSGSLLSNPERKGTRCREYRTVLAYVTAKSQNMETRAFDRGLLLTLSKQSKVYTFDRFLFSPDSAKQWASSGPDAAHAEEYITFSSSIKAIGPHLWKCRLTTRPDFNVGNLLQGFHRYNPSDPKCMADSNNLLKETFRDYHVHLGPNFSLHLCSLKPQTITSILSGPSDYYYLAYLKPKANARGEGKGCGILTANWIQEPESGKWERRLACLFDAEPNDIAGFQAMHRKLPVGAAIRVATSTNNSAGYSICYAITGATQMDSQFKECALLWAKSLNKKGSTDSLSAADLQTHTTISVYYDIEWKSSSA